MRRLEEIRAWRNARECPVPEWQFIPPEGPPAVLGIKAFWPVVATPVRFEATARIPNDWAGQPVELELWLGGEGLIRLSTGLQSGLDPHHHSFRIADAARGGEEIRIEAEVVPKGMFGTHIRDPRIERAHLVIPEREARALERDLAMIVAACEQLQAFDHEVVPFLLDTLDEALAEVAKGLPTATDVSVTRHILGYENPIGSGVFSVSPSYGAEAWDVTPPHQAIWHTPPPPRPLEPLPAAAVEAIRAARVLIAQRLEALKRDYPPVGRLALTGHAHIDLAWLWPVAETRRKGRRTFSNVLALMDRYEDFIFNQSSAQLYAWIEEDDPDLFARVKKRVAEGRWEPIGGSWVEPDCQVTGGESFVRQLFYGQRYFEQRFGRRSRVAWLPDVFGFSGGIPQLLRGAGIEGFFTVKLTWSETDRFPYDLFAWEGIDGSRVTAHMFRNLHPAHGYNANIAPLDTHQTWRNFDGKRLHPESLLAFGWGDGGGGPSERMLENYARIKDFPALPRLRMARIEEFFTALPDRDRLPTWVGELYLEFHRGTLTTQARVKALNRASEHRLLEAEAFGALAARKRFAYPGADLERAWKTLLLNQFHDILPGSSIREVYEVTVPELEGVVATASQARDAALLHLGGGSGVGGGWLIANAGARPRPLCALLPIQGDATVTDEAGRRLPSQVTEDGLLIAAPDVLVPALGWVRLGQGDGMPAASASPPGVTARAEGETTVIENDLLRVVIGSDGTLHAVFDKVANREALAGRGNQLWAYVDKPRVYDAWELEETYEREGEEIGGVESIEIVEGGPLRAAVRVRRAYRDSRITQTYRLLTGSRRLDVVTEIDWHERMVLIKARFPLAVHSHEATFETMYGVVRRPTHRNTSWDAARFEVSGHRFADLSEPGYGVALLNDGKYGHSAYRNELTLSLIRGPLYPDLFADEGHHRFTYSLLPHVGDWVQAGVVFEAFALNSPLVAVPAAGDGTAGPARWGLFETEGLPVALGSLKPAEDGDGLILRIYEPHGARGTTTLRFAEPVQHVERVNLLEEPVGADASPVAVSGSAVQLSLRPFEVVTLRVRL